VNWEEVPIGKRQDRESFNCGDADLNVYLKRCARQNHDSGGAKCFLAVPADQPSHILGSYTLSPASLEYARTPALVKRGLARYDVPFAWGGWLWIKPKKDRGLAAACCCGRPLVAFGSLMKSAAWRS
jgi:hypothetical protein